MDNNNQATEPTTSYAGFWIRWFAQLVDSVIWSISFFLAFYLLSLFGTSSVESFIPGVLWFLLFSIFAAGLIKFFVQPWLISTKGGGLGKLACGLEITKDGGTPLTYKNALFREYIAKMASNALLGLGYYWIFKTPKKQGWHDSLSGTCVTKKHEGFISGLMVLILSLGIIGGLSYKSYDNFKNAKTLQLDFITLITQIQQDFSKEKTNTVPSTSLQNYYDLNYDTNIKVQPAITY